MSKKKKKSRAKGVKCSKTYFHGEGIMLPDRGAQGWYVYSRLFHPQKSQAFIDLKISVPVVF